MRYQLRWGIFLCALLMAGPGFGQRKPRIKGNRSVISVEKQLPPFSSLVVSEDLEVQLQPGDGERIRIEADDNLIDVLRFEVEGNTLTISSFYTITGSKKLELILEYQDLEQIRLEAGRLSTLQTLNTDELQLTLLEGSRANLNLQAGFVDLRLAGNSAADLRITTDSLSAEMADYTDTRIYASGGPVNLVLTGQASLDLEGVSESLTASLTDNTRIQAMGMEATEVRAFLNTSANARFYAASRISYEGRGSARLFVYGQPEIRILGMYDSSELHKVPD